MHACRYFILVRLRLCDLSPITAQWCESCPSIWSCMTMWSAPHRWYKVGPGQGVVQFLYPGCFLGLFSLGTNKQCVGSHFSESESELARSCPTLCDLMDCSLPGSSLHGILQARVLESGAVAFSRGSSRVVRRWSRKPKMLGSNPVRACPLRVWVSSWEL